MRIGLLGAGHIGKILARKLAAAGHEVKVANSRGPETIDPEALSTGARAVTAAEAFAGVDVAILSIPLNRIPDAAPLVAGLPEGVVVIDTSNYYPMRDDRIEAIEAGQVESEWVAERLGRPVVKAWNSILAASLAAKGTAPGTRDRIALPVAADREADLAVGRRLVEDTGFGAFDAGTLAESWRQQPGAPAYCTDLSLAELPAALAATERARLPKRRELAIAVILERLEGDATLDPEDAVRVCRAVYR